MSIYEKEGGRKALCTCALSSCTLGGSGGILPQKTLAFRQSETACGTFSGTVY